MYLLLIQKSKTIVQRIWFPVLVVLVIDFGQKELPKRLVIELGLIELGHFVQKLVSLKLFVYNVAHLGEKSLFPRVADTQVYQLLIKIP